MIRPMRAPGPMPRSRDQPAASATAPASDEEQGDHGAMIAHPGPRGPGAGPSAGNQ